MASDRLHPVRVQLRGRGPPGRRRTDLRTDPWRQGPPGVEGLHLREGAAPRLLPERARRAAAEPASPPTRRHLRGDRLGHRHPRGRRAAWPRCATPTEASRSSTTAAAGRATISAAPTARRPWPRSVFGSGRTRSRRRRPARCWSWARCSGRRCAATSSTARSRSFLGKNPWISHGIPHARTTLKAIAADPDRAMIVIDPRVTETAAMADYHLQVRPGRDAWLHRRHGGGARRRGPRRPRLAASPRVRLRTGARRARRGADLPVLRDQRCRRGAGARRHPADRGGRPAWPRSRTSACR